MKFVRVPAGSFMMGQNGGDPDERPVHKVTITKPFYLQTTEVTQGQWQMVMGNNPSYFKDCGDDCPVEEVSWRTGARTLASPLTAPEAALREAVKAVYGATGSALNALADWFARGERAYFSRSTFTVGDGSLSLEPLIWKENPDAPGPPVYLRDRMSADLRAEYARELEQLRAELVETEIPNREAIDKTVACIEGTLHDIAALA